MKRRRVFVAATGQHVGKTTSTLGLVANLISKGIKTGYCKPVGQKHLNVGGLIADKDAFLFSKVIGFQMDPDIHSPVILGSGVTAQYIDDPFSFDFESRVDRAVQVLESENEMVVYEGTGHPGVGSVVDLSNADVAKRIDAPVIMVVEGGIGNTIDKLSMSLSLFKQKNCEILGVIVNKVRQDKYDKINHFLSKKFKSLDIPLLGVLPYDPTLSLPIMATIKQAVNGKVLLNGGCLGNKVEDIIPGSLITSHEFTTFKNILLVVSSLRLNEAIDKIQHISEVHQLEKSPLSGIIVTNPDGDKIGGNEIKTFQDNPYFIENEIPIISTTLDTYGSVVKVSRIEVKINTRTPWKSKRAIELIKENVNLEYLLEKLDFYAET